ncbi:MAG: hydrogenase [Mariprofundales bacterium]
MYKSFMPLQIVSNTCLTADCADAIHLLKLSSAKNTNIMLPPFHCGQYVRILLIDDIDSNNAVKTAPAYFALASSPEMIDKEGYSLLVKCSGDVAKNLCQASVGDSVLVEAPQGKGFSIDLCNNRDVFLLGVGTGIAPLRSLWQYMQQNRQNFGNIAIYAGFLTPQHIILADELKALQSNNIDVHITVSNISDDWSGYVGFVQHILRNHKPDGKNAIACLSGMQAMTNACTETLLELGFAKQHILLNY